MDEKNPCMTIPSDYTQSRYACLTMNMSDRLRLIRFPLPIIDYIREAINISWPHGISREKSEIKFYEFKLYGNPWWGQGDEGISSRILMTHILSTLHSHGWYLLAPTDVSKKQSDKDTLIFELGIPSNRTRFCSVSFNDYDKLRLIDVPREIILAFKQSLGRINIQREELLYKGRVYQLKLRGNPWVAHGEEAITSRLTLLALLDCFSRFGWKLHASIDISEGHDGRDTDSWFLRQDIE